jgi:hypothetical protein
MRSTPTRLLFRKKITAIYADGSSRMNLGIATVVRMLKGATHVPVEVAADAAARILFAELARSAGRTVERASAGIFLTPPVVQPGVEQRAVPFAPAVPALQPSPRAPSRVGREGTAANAPRKPSGNTPRSLRRSSRDQSRVRSTPCSKPGR